MAAIRTEITEIMTGLAMLGFRDLDEALRVRPMSVVNLTTAHYERLDQARRAGTHQKEFATAWENGRVFARAEDGLRGRPPWTIEWKGPHRPPGYEQVPADLRIDHVYLVSCKYGSSILHNVSPAHLFDRALAERRVERGADWFVSTALDAYQDFYDICVAHTELESMPASVTELSSADRLALKAALPKRGRLPVPVQKVYEEFSAAVSAASAQRWQRALTKPAQREEMLWRLLRLQAAPYFVLGARPTGESLRYRVGTPWDFRSAFKLLSLDAWAEAAGQPLVRWRAEVEHRDEPSGEPSGEPGRGRIASIEGHVEIRWTHGRFSGAPEAKVHLDTHPHHVPGYFPIA